MSAVSGSLYDLVPESWKAKGGMALVRAFPIFGISVPDQASYFSEIKNLKVPWGPGFFHIGQLNDFKQPFQTAKAVASQDGGTRLVGVPFELSLSGVPALTIMTPFEGPEQEQHARQRLDQMAAWIGLNMGPHLATHSLFEFQVCLETSDLITASNVIAVPGRFRKDHPDGDMMGRMAVASETIRSASEDVKNRINRALLHCYDAMQEGDQTKSSFSIGPQLRYFVEEQKLDKKFINNTKVAA
jgi:hypothetical protein